VDKAKLTVRQITLFAMLGALTFALKWAMSFLPNIEPVTLMVLIFGAVFGWKAVFPVYTYVAAEFLFYGIGQWNLYYLYIWLIPLAMGVFLRKMESPLGWAIGAAFFGLAFGALCAPVNVIMGGWGYGLSWWVNGIYFDLLHCAGNFVMALLLFVPLRKLVEKLYR
jgi:energy-coupling factor transport system substrate-specific component